MLHAPGAALEYTHGLGRPPFAKFLTIEVRVADVPATVAETRCQSRDPASG
jgi:hypothetical protein